MTPSIICDSFEKRLEEFYSWKDHLSHYLSKGVEYDPRNNVCMVRSRPEGKNIIKDWFYGKNIVTTDGSLYYSRKAVGATIPANEDFGGSNARFEIGNGNATTPGVGDTRAQLENPVASSIVPLTASYPKLDDQRAENTGKGPNVISYSALYSAGLLNGGVTVTGINQGIIHGNPTPTNASKILSRWLFTGGAFDITPTDVLEPFLNHTMVGIA